MIYLYKLLKNIGSENITIKDDDDGQNQQEEEKKDVVKLSNEKSGNKPRKKGCC